MQNLYRQGDVLLMEIQEIPPEAKPVEQSRIVLAYGEVTGHCHQISIKEAVEKVTDSDRFLEVLADEAFLNHEEHSTIALPKGKYKIVQQKEHTPQAIRNVVD